MMYYDEVQYLIMMCYKASNNERAREWYVCGTYVLYLGAIDNAISTMSEPSFLDRDERIFFYPITFRSLSNDTQQKYVGSGDE